MKCTYRDEPQPKKTPRQPVAGASINSGDGHAKNAHTRTRTKPNLPRHAKSHTHAGTHRTQATATDCRQQLYIYGNLLRSASTVDLKLTELEPPAPVAHVLLIHPPLPPPEKHGDLAQHPYQGVAGDARQADPGIVHLLRDGHVEFPQERLKGELGPLAANRHAHDVERYHRLPLLGAVPPKIPQSSLDHSVLAPPLCLLGCPHQALLQVLGVLDRHARPLPQRR
mmetsp:Transcript_20168/g.50451  ORF Transcript_20168/g.50451 Transcript_20168/m.50451 type:complete len:225 (-) Transcript_20168:12-686(-)